MRATIGLLTVVLAVNTSAAEMVTTWTDYCDRDIGRIKYRITNTSTYPHTNAEAISFFLPIADADYLYMLGGMVNTGVWIPQPDSVDVDGDGNPEEGWRLTCGTPSEYLQYPEYMDFYGDTESDHWSLRPVLQVFLYGAETFESIVWVNLPSNAPLPGDADLNGVVDFRDAWTVLGSFRNGTGFTWVEGDFNGDGVVNMLDVEALRDNYDGTMPAGIAAAIAATVPEPGTLLLLTIGVAGSLARKRRR